MKASVYGSTVLTVCMMMVYGIRPGIATSSEGSDECADVAQRGVLHVMTLNLLFSEVPNRTARLERIANFVRSQFETGQPVDVLLLQEAAGGVLVYTGNSAQDLQAMLHDHHALDYHLSSAYASGVPGILTIFNATLSRCAITTSLWRLLPPATELEFQGHVIPLSCSVLMTRLQLPGVGPINVYNTHLVAMNEMAMEHSSAVQTAAAYLLRYGLVLVIAWIGFMKFTAYEAAGVQPLMANSPLMGWVYAIFSERAFSALLGVVEVAVAAMIALRPVSARVSAIGSGLAAVMFLTTLTFLFSTPGWEPRLGGFPALSVVPGQFLIKDIVLLGAALWSLGEALPEARS